MKVKATIIFVAYAYFFCSGVHCLRILKKNNIWEENHAVKLIDDGLEPDFYENLSTGPEKLPIEIFEMGENILKEEGEEKEKFPESEVDEETIRKAEKMADKDLLNGLNRILKNNETLKDVFRAENVYEIP